MKMHHVVAATSAALLSFAAIAGGQQNPSGAATDPQSQGASAQGSADPAIVRQAQERLMSEGFDPGAVDGRLGPQTRQGLKDFQQSKGLEPSGQLDPQTIVALGISSDTSGAAGGSAPERAAEPSGG